MAKETPGNHLLRRVDIRLVGNQLGHVGTIGRGIDIATGLEDCHDQGTASVRIFLGEFIGGAQVEEYGRLAG